MDLLTGISLFNQQVIALLKKNFILSWRSRIATFLHLFSSFFFIAFMFALEKTDHYRERNPHFSEAVHDPKAIINPPIPACEDKLIIKLPCYDFVWSGNGNQRLESIVNGIMANNPGRRIPESKVKSFRTKDELNTWLMDNPMSSPGALHFVETNAKEIRYGIETNSSSSFAIGRQTEDPLFKFQIPLQYAASREISRSLIGDPNFSFDIGLKEFARPASKIESSHRQDDLVETFRAVFFVATSMFAFTFQIHSLALEKELKLRQMMSTMGLYDAAYWSSWFIWEGFMAFLSSLLIVAFGAMFQVGFFLKNNIVVVFVLFFLFMISMVSFAFMISTFIRKSSSATSVGFSILILGIMTVIFSSLFYTDSMKRRYRILWSFFPPNPFAGGLALLISAVDQGGISWSKRAECAADESTCFSMIYFYTWLVSIFLLFSVLAIYFDNIIPNSAGVRKPLLYFLKPSYWTGRGDYKLEEDVINLGSSSATLPDHFSLDEEVHEEEDSVKKAAKEGIVDPEVAVQLRGLVKSYSKALKISCQRCCFCFFCCKCKIRKPFDAVKDIWMNFPKNQLFCLLGPNGAGKSTIISCLTGITPLTRGDAIIYGNSIRSSRGMSTIRRMTGVCAQFDSLWDALSGKEHLHLFARIKGLPPATHKSEAQRLLADVDIAEIANVRAGNYSGGTKRRVSLAIALIGDPKLLILDEPTTGMDPITKRRVWNVIENAKQGRSIILTTHSMLEADILSDRIGIMAKGRLRCIGTSTVLKSRFGAGYIAKVSFPKGISNVYAEENDINAGHRKAVKFIFEKQLNVEPKGETEYLLTFTLPNVEEEILAEFFNELGNREREFGIKNIQLGLGTLEEVFLNIAKKAELETSDPKESMKTLTLTSGATLQVPLGAEYVRIPGTESRQNPRGLMVEVFWAQDDLGNLCISSHSDEKPVPSNLQLPVSSSVTYPRNVFGRRHRR